METFGGAERVTAEIAQAFPDAPVIALLGRESVAERMGVADRFRSVVKPSEALLRHYRVGAGMWGAVADRVRLPEADVVISSSYGFAHRMRRPGAKTVCYCHSPLRFAWSMTDQYRSYWARSSLKARAFDVLAGAMRRSDYLAAGRIDQYLTQSQFTADQIRRFYGRDSAIIGAPVDASRFRPGRDQGDHFLLVSRLVEPYKRVGIAIDAFRRMPDKRLIVVGDGPSAASLREDLPPNVEMVGMLEDQALVEMMQTCVAGIFPSRDDFGLVPVEMMACGRPVLAYADGGALHTVRPGVSGGWFHEQTPEAIVEAVEAFDPSHFAADAVREHARTWDRPVFQERMVRAVDALWGARSADPVRRPLGPAAPVQGGLVG